MAGFPHSSVGKESAYNAEDPGSIPGSGRSAGEGIDYPLQYSWASLVAQMVKNLPAMQQAWVRSQGEKIFWRRVWQPFQYSCLEKPMDRGAWWATVHGVTESQTQLSNFHFQTRKPQRRLKCFEPQSLRAVD